MAAVKRQKTVDMVPPSVLAAIANDPEGFEKECQRWLDAKTAADEAQAALLSERKQYEQERQRREAELRQRGEAMVADQKRLDAGKVDLTARMADHALARDALARREEQHRVSVEARDNEWADRLNSLERDRNAMTAQTKANEVERARLSAWAEALKIAAENVKAREAAIKELAAKL